ncbi:phospholipase D-like domain-containing protein DpdK [Spirillospora sp. NPDC048819]|uniref:phospholipase D-like domain-containing protein DpdK n=1 Tax=Spirillospora sp. NPDC048819 TaxID=3155268 RepID=UPI0033D49F34
MIETERNIRPSRATGITVDSVMRAALLSELVRPVSEGRTLWLVSGWVTEVPVIDNSYGAYDALLGDDFPAVANLSHVLGAIHRRGTFVNLVTMRLPRNEVFANQLRRAAGDTPEPHITDGEVAHEKTLCTNSWLIEGSMNFTRNGLGVNDESVNYTTNSAKIAKALMDFADRWEGK